MDNWLVIEWLTSHCVKNSFNLAFRSFWLACRYSWLLVTWFTSMLKIFWILLWSGAFSYILFRIFWKLERIMMSIDLNIVSFSSQSLVLQSKSNSTFLREWCFGYSFKDSAPLVKICSFLPYYFDFLFFFLRWWFFPHCLIRNIFLDLLFLFDWTFFFEQATCSSPFFFAEILNHLFVIVFRYLLF